MAGRRPKPTANKEAAGTWRADRHNQKEPKGRRGIPAAPSWLSDAAREYWADYAEQFNLMGVLTKADATALAQLCECHAELVEARKVLEEEGSYYETTNQHGDTMTRAHPAVSRAQNADRRLRAWLVEFGATPAARSKVNSNGEEDPEDPSDKYFT